MPLAVVDTDILIDIQSGNPQAEAWLRAIPVMGITPINWFEMMIGVKRRDSRTRLQTVRFLTTFEMLYLTAEDQKWAVDIFGLYNPSHGIPWSDVLIASVCVRLGITLYARDNHFRVIPELAFVSPYTR